MMICHDDNARLSDTVTITPPHKKAIISTEAAENTRLLKQWLLNKSQWHIFNQGHGTDHRILRMGIRG